MEKQEQRKIQGRVPRIILGTLFPVIVILSLPILLMFSEAIAVEKATFLLLITISSSLIILSLIFSILMDFFVIAKTGALITYLIGAVLAVTLGIISYFKPFSLIALLMALEDKGLSSTNSTSIILVLLIIVGCSSSLGIMTSVILRYHFLQTNSDKKPKGRLIRVALGLFLSIMIMSFASLTRTMIMSSAAGYPMVAPLLMSTILFHIYPAFTFSMIMELDITPKVTKKRFYLFGGLLYSLFIFIESLTTTFITYGMQRSQVNLVAQLVLAYFHIFTVGLIISAILKFHYNTYNLTSDSNKNILSE